MRIVSIGILFFLSVLASGLSSIAQQRYIGNPSLGSFANGSAVLNDGNRVFVGGLKKASSVDEDAIISCVNTSTNALVWEKEIATAGNDRFNAVVATSDGGCVAVGYVNQNLSSIFANTQACVYKFNASGSLVWHKIFEKGTQGEIFFSVTEVPTSGNIVCVGVADYGIGSAAGLVVNLSSAGLTNWAKVYAGSQNEMHDIRYNNGNLLGIGHFASPSLFDGMIFSLSEATGSVNWVKGIDYASTFSPSSNTNYLDRMDIVGGRVYIDAYLSPGSSAPTVSTFISPSILSLDTLGNSPVCLEYPINGNPYSNVISSKVVSANEIYLFQHPTNTHWNRLFSQNPISNLSEVVITKVTGGLGLGRNIVYTRKINTSGSQAIVGADVQGARLSAWGGAKSDPAFSMGSTDMFYLQDDTALAITALNCIANVSGQRSANPTVTFPLFTFTSVTNATFTSATDPAVNTTPLTIVLPCSNTITPDFVFKRTACLTDSFADISATTLTGIKSWSWTFGDGGISALKNPVHTYASFGTYSVKLVVTDSAGAKDSVTKLVDIRSYRFLTVNKIMSVCQSALPATVSLSAGGGKTFLWSPSAGLSNASVANPTATISGPITYVVNATDSLGCTDKDSTVISLRQASVTIVPDSGRVCEGADFTMSGRGAVKYKWTPSFGLNNDTAATTVARIIDTIDYVVVGTDTFGCSARDTIHVVSIPAPKVIINADSLEVCQFSLASAKASGALKYKWTPGGLGNDSLEDISIKADSNFYLKLRGWNSDGCEGTDSMYIFTKPSPAVKIYCDDPTVGCGGETYVDAAGANQYEWWPREYFSDPNGMSSKVNLNRTSFIYLRGTIDNGCTGMDSLEIRFDNESWVQIPNAFTPNGDGRNDYIRPIIVCNFYFLEFAIYNRWGQQVFFDVANNTPWNGTFNGQPCEPGVYYYYVKGKDSGGKLIVLKGDIALIR